MPPNTDRLGIDTHDLDQEPVETQRPTGTVWDFENCEDCDED